MRVSHKSAYTHHLLHKAKDTCNRAFNKIKHCKDTDSSLARGLSKVKHIANRIGKPTALPIESRDCTVVEVPDSNSLKSQSENVSESKKKQYIHGNDGSVYVVNNARQSIMCTHEDYCEKVEIFLGKANNKPCIRIHSDDPVFNGIVVQLRPENPSYSFINDLVRAVSSGRYGTIEELIHSKDDSVLSFDNLEPQLSSCMTKARDMKEFYLEKFLHMSADEIKRDLKINGDSLIPALASVGTRESKHDVVNNFIDVCARLDDIVSSYILDNEIEDPTEDKECIARKKIVKIIKKQLLEYYKTTAVKDFSRIKKHFGARDITKIGTSLGTQALENGKQLKLRVQLYDKNNEEVTLFSVQEEGLPSTTFFLPLFKERRNSKKSNSSSEGGFKKFTSYYNENPRMRTGMLEYRADKKQKTIANMNMLQELHRTKQKAIVTGSKREREGAGLLLLPYYVSLPSKNHRSPLLVTKVGNPVAPLVKNIDGVKKSMHDRLLAFDALHGNGYYSLDSKNDNTLLDERGRVVTIDLDRCVKNAVKDNAYTYYSQYLSTLYKETKSSSVGMLIDYRALFISFIKMASSKKVSAMLSKSAVMPSKDTLYMEVSHEEQAKIAKDFGLTNQDLYDICTLIAEPDALFKERTDNCIDDESTFFAIKEKMWKIAKTIGK